MTSSIIQAVQASDPLYQPDSIQAQVELYYIAQANQIVEQQLETLTNNVINAKNALDALSSLQLIKNRLTIEQPDDFSYSGDNASDYASQASDQFGHPLEITAGDVSDIQQYITQLQNLIPTLPGDPGDPNSLVSRLQQVIDDVGGDPEAWLLDNYNAGVQGSSDSAQQAGLFQQNLTFAITAAQNTNDLQTEQVQRYMYVFEEYYKSAASMLSALNTMLTSIARGIGK